MEQALLGHPEVVECAVVGAPDEERGMIVKAFVVLNPGAPGTCTADGAAGLRQAGDRARTSGPRAVEFVDALPRTSTGKLQRYKLR